MCSTDALTVSILTCFSSSPQRQNEQECSVLLIGVRFHKFFTFIKTSLHMFKHGPGTVQCVPVYLRPSVQFLNYNNKVRVLDRLGTERKTLRLALMLTCNLKSRKATQTERLEQHTLFSDISWRGYTHTHETWYSMCHLKGLTGSF